MSPHGLGLGVPRVMWEGQGPDLGRCWQRQRWLDALAGCPGALPAPCLRPLTPRGGDGGGTCAGPCFRSALAWCRHGGHTGVLGHPRGEWGRGLAVPRWRRGWARIWGRWRSQGGVGVLGVPGRAGGLREGFGMPKARAVPSSWPTPFACCWSTRRPPTRSASTALAQVSGGQAGSDPPKSPPPQHLVPAAPAAGETPPVPSVSRSCHSHPLLPARGSHLCPLRTPAQ